MTVINVEKLDSGDLLSSLDDALARRLRIDITKARKRKETMPIRCGLCKEPLFLRRNYFGEAGYHFSHFKTDDPVLKRCLQRTDNNANMDLMRALKYQGAKESSLHYNLKHLIADLLSHDERIESDSVKIESILSSEDEWRRPDVQAVVDNNLIAFEVQVSTEMAPMIIAREYFYERFGNIIWILPCFDPDKINQSETDILTTNNDHLFVLTKEMRGESRNNNELTLEVWVHWPILEANRLEWVWKTEIARLRDITFKNGHVYLLDVHTEEDRLRERLKAIKEREAEAALLQRNREEARLKQERQQDLAKDNWYDWWSKWDMFCDELAHPDNQLFLRNRLISDNIWSQPISTLAGLWLALHGVYIRRCNCSEFVLKSLICASKGQLDYGYTSWKYIVNGLIKDHLIWFPPFYKVLKINAEFSIIEEIRKNKKIAEIIEELKKTPVRLSDEQRNLLGLIEPKLQIRVHHYNLEVPDARGPRFLYSMDQGTLETGHDIFPSDMSMIHYYMKNHSYEKLVMGRYSNNIINVLRHLQESGNYIPFPNIPLREAENEYYIEYDECADILPSWGDQLFTLQKELSTI